MATPEYLEEFKYMQIELEIAAEALRSLRKDTHLRRDLERAVKDSSLRLKQYYVDHLKNVKIPDADRIRLECICRSLRGIPFANRSVMGIIVSEMLKEQEQGHGSVPGRKVFLELWQAMESQYYDNTKMVTLLIDALLPHPQTNQVTESAQAYSPGGRHNDAEGGESLQSVPAGDPK
ncbi:MAG: hypothetical protein Q9170_008054, partial [Blastenia crenularia]